MTERDLNDFITQRFRAERERKIENYRFLNQIAEKGQILFTGSSLMEQFPLNELAQGRKIPFHIYNRGVGGFTTDDFLNHIDVMLFDLEPGKVFMNIGTNDIHDRYENEDWFSHLFGNYRIILDLCKNKIPHDRIYLMAFYPVNPEVPGAQNPFSQAMMKLRTSENLARSNREIDQLAREYGYHYIDVNAGLCDERGLTKPQFSVDGVHMYPNAYGVVMENLMQYLR